MNFKDCNLIEPILKALDEQGYTEPTAIQAGAIRPALEGRDVLGIARTGTGKTCAFATPILQRLQGKPVQGRPIRALVLTPTRELAIQNQECFESYGKYLPLRSVVIFGGVGQNPQVEAIRQGADILVATPGRLADLYQQKLLDLSRLEIFVLDEADRMLDMGFIHDVKKILKWLPKRKQTLFFSATMPAEITELVASLLHRPVRVAVDPVNTTVDAIEQWVCKVDRTNKTKLLVHLLREKDLPSVLVFTRTKHGANKVARDLEKAKVSAAAIHGNKSQTARQQALSDFKAGKLQVLVATDIAARGLDIEELSCVVNYNLPEVPETYVHRIGRTGRAGREGIAIALCDYQELNLLKDIEKLIRKTIPVVEDHPWPMENFDEPVRDRHGKVRNPEDEEARAAARERAKERRAAQKAAESANASQSPQDEAASGKAPAAAKAPQSGKASKSSETAENAKEPKPQSASRQAPGKKSEPSENKAPAKGKKSGKSEQQSAIGVVPIPDLLPTKEERALLEQQNDHNYTPEDLLLRRTAYKRPERKVIPSLSSVSLLPQVELKESFVRKSDQLQMNRPVKQIPREDATARLFSQRREEPAAEPEPVQQESQKAASKKRKKKSGAQSAAVTPEQKPAQKSAAKQDQKPAQKAAAKQEQKNAQKSAPKAEQKPAAKSGRKSGKKSRNTKRNDAARKEQQEQRVVFTVASEEKKKRSGRTHPSFSEAKSGRQKDSTEQKSLMKPYYLSDRRKG